MRAISKWRYTINNQKLISKSNSPINIQQLTQSFSQHFKKEYLQYETPIFSDEGLLAYTSRFAKTVLNLSDRNEQQKKDHFSVIKQSIKSDKQFTPLSCTQLCQSFISFRFQGDQEQCLQKMRKYITKNEYKFNIKKIDQFILAHRFLMTENAQGPIKFVDVKLKHLNLENEALQYKVRSLFKQYGVTQFHWNWNLKKQLIFQLNFQQRKRIIRFQCLEQNKLKNNDDINLLTSRIAKLSTMDDNHIIIVNDKNNDSQLNLQILGRQLLVQRKLFQSLQLSSKDSGKLFHHKIVKSILQNRPNHQRISCINVSEIDYLNYILQNSTTDELYHLFQYIKLNVFHIQFQKLLSESKWLKNKTFSYLQQFSYIKMFQVEEYEKYNMIHRSQMIGKGIIDLLKQRQQKTVSVYVSKQLLPELLYYVLKQSKPTNIVKQRLIFAQNLNSKQMINKMSIISLFYQLNIDLPKVLQQTRRYRQIIHPLTAHLRESSNKVDNK